MNKMLPSGASPAGPEKRTGIPSPLSSPDGVVSPASLPRTDSQGGSIPVVSDVPGLVRRSLPEDDLPQAGDVSMGSDRTAVGADGTLLEPKAVTGSDSGTKNSTDIPDKATEMVVVEQPPCPAAVTRFDEISSAIAPHLEKLLPGGRGLDADAQEALSRSELEKTFDIPGKVALLEARLEAYRRGEKPQLDVTPGWTQFREFDPGGGGESTCLKITDHKEDDPGNALMTTITKLDQSTSVVMRRLLSDGSEDVAVSIGPLGTDSHWVQNVKVDDAAETKTGVSVTLKTSPSGEIEDYVLHGI